jgi:tetratricopeptide (TPR) repeat protein
METLDLNIHDPEEFERKCITCNGCEYIIGSYIASGSFKIVHHLINRRSNLSLHVLLVFLGEPEIAFPTLEKEYKTLSDLADASGLPQGIIKLQGYGGAIAMEKSLNSKEQEPKSTYNLTEVAESFLSSSDWTEASSWYQRILDINPDHTHALNNLAYIQSKLGNWETSFSLTGSQAIPESSPSRPRQEILLYSEEEKGGRGIE